MDVLILSTTSELLQANQGVIKYLTAGIYVGEVSSLTWH